MMKLPILILALVLLTIQKPIQQLNPHKLANSIASQQFTLVYFYSASCQFCQAFTPKFEQASKVNTNDKVIFGKFDGPGFPQITEKYQVHSYPTIALFWKNVDMPIFYYQQRQTENLLNFIKQSTRSLQASITEEQYNKLTEAQRSEAIFYFGSTDDQAFKVTSVLAYVQNYRPFILVNGTESSKPSLQIKGMKYDKFQVHHLQNLIARQFATLHIIDEEAWRGIHEKRKPGIVFIDTAKNGQAQELLKKMMKKYPNIVFMKVDVSQEEYEPALEALGLEDREQIMGVMKNADALFEAPKPYTQQSLEDFIEKFLNLTWPVYRKSEKEGDKYKLTRNNYEEKINETKDIIIFLYKDTDKSKRKFLELFKYVALKLKVNDNIRFYRCNLSKNELEEKFGFVPKSTPSLFFLRNRMKDYPIHFHQSSLTPQTIIEFIMQNTTFDWQDEWTNLSEL